MNLNPSPSSALNSGFTSAPLAFIANSCEPFLPSLRKQMQFSGMLRPMSTVSPSSKFHPTTSFLFMTAIEWWKEMAVEGLFPFCPIRQVPVPIPQLLQNYLSRTNDSWHSPTIMLPDTDRSTRTLTSNSFSLRLFAPTAAKRWPEWETLQAVRESAEMLRQGCLAEWEKQSMSGEKMDWETGTWLTILLLEVTDWLFMSAERLAPLRGESLGSSSSFLEGVLRRDCWLFLLRFLKMLFILLISSLFSYTCCLRLPSSSSARYTMFPTPAASPSSSSSPNSLPTNSTRCCRCARSSSFSRCASSSSGSMARREARECPWWSSWAQSRQLSWFLALTHSGARQRAVTISPWWAYLRVQQNMIDAMKLLSLESAECHHSVEAEGHARPPQLPHRPTLHLRAPLLPRTALAPHQTPPLPRRGRGLPPDEPPLLPEDGPGEGGGQLQGWLALQVLLRPRVAVQHISFLLLLRRLVCAQLHP